MKYVGWLLAGLLVVTGCDTTPPVDLEAEKRALLDIHAEVLRAHREDDVAGWLELEAEQMDVAGRGEIMHPTVEERRTMREGYLGATEFDWYRDLQDPIVSVSDDGTLGWLIAQVEAKGTYTAEDGTTQPIEFVSAWVELYRRESGRWLMVGNVSNFRPPPDAE